MTPDTVEDGGRRLVGEGKRVEREGREILGRRGGLRKRHFGARVEEVWLRRGRCWSERKGGQQPVLDDRSTHYSTDAAADPVEKEEPLSLSRIAAVVAGPTLLRVLTPLLPAVSTSQGRICVGNSSFVTFDKPRNNIAQDSSDWTLDKIHPSLTDSNFFFSK